ncbi:SOS response-associated peptidase family protein [Escherichia coli]
MYHIDFTRPLSYSFQYDLRRFLCGRFAQSQTREDYLALLAEDVLNAIFPMIRTHWQIQRRAGNQSPTARERDEHLHLDPVFWGYASGWWDKPPLINARVETVATSGMLNRSGNMVGQSVCRWLV